MKRIFVLLLGVLATPAFANVTLTLDAGRLRGFGGTSLPTGSVLVLVAAGLDNTFSNTLSAGQYVSGDDILLSVLSAPNSYQPFNPLPGTDETTNSFVITPLNFPNLAPGQLLALRWFSSISSAQFAAGTTPIAGDHFGIYNPIFWGNGSNSPDGGDSWVYGGDGQNLNLNFITTDAVPPPGTQNPLEGWAQFTVVPEPSSVMLGGVSLLGAAAFRLRKRRS